MVKGEKRTKKTVEPVTRDYTIHLAKLVHKVAFKNRAPRAVREIKTFASKMMKTKVRELMM
jgi:large subunit ribosomal protein L31e